jgi:hypothetical protein
MKFRMVNLGYCQSPDYPWDYRIELIEYELHEREQLTDWLTDHNIEHITAGWNTGSVLYMKEQDATMFAVRWTS